MLKLVALFECAAPIRHEKGARLQFTFEYLGSGVDTLGEFRLSTTADPKPLRELGHPLAEWPKTQERINQAIDRGVHALLTQQERDGSWKKHQGRFPAGQTALSLYTGPGRSGGGAPSPPLRRGAADQLRLLPGLSGGNGGVAEDHQLP